MKTRRRFAWSVVPTPLKRKLLRAVEADHLARRATDEQLTDRLAYLYGARPAEWAFKSRELGAVLLAEWVPDLPKAELQAIAAEVTRYNGLKPAGSSRQHLIDFLQDRNLAAGFRSIIRSHFLAAFTAAFPVASSGASFSAPSREDFSGQGLPASHELFPHQVEAHAALTGAISLRARTCPTGLLVLPTGSGKTRTAVQWLVDTVLPKGVQVLWLAHQRELLLQAQRTFRTVIAEQPLDTSYRSRLIVGGAGGITLLGAADTDIAFVSLPMLATRFDKAKQRRLEAFLARPTVVVVDEAHHGGSGTYHKVLLACRKVPGTRAVLGLTATPWPGALLGKVRFHEVFDRVFYEAHAEGLTEAGVLARPVVHTIETDELFELTDEERVRNETAPDFTDEVLSRLDTVRRNRLVVAAYQARQKLFAKSLVFAANIDHADHLGNEFARARVPVKVVHGQADSGRQDAIDWFEGHDEPAVLVSVRMLTEGVDLPSARSVILARPTTSRILLRQMIGRALRGPLVPGGSREAHVVNIRDQWANLGDILEPPEVIELPRVEQRTERHRPGRAGDPWELPDIQDEEGQLLPAAVEAEADRLIDENEQLIAAAIADGPQRRRLDPAERERLLRPVVRMTVSPLAGWYQLPDRTVTVFEHQLPGFQDLIAQAPRDLQGTPLLDFFDDLAPPLPSPRAVKAIVEHVRAFGPPDFHPFLDRSLPHVVARELAEGARTEAAVEAHVRERWSRGAIRLQMSLLDFEEAVDAERRRLRRRLRGATAGLVPEDPAPTTIDPSSLPKLRYVERDPDPIMAAVVAWMKENTPTIAPRLDPLPQIGWTKHRGGSTWGQWTLDTRGRTRGRTRIRINRLLSTSKAVVSDEMLQYLVYHELLHHVLSTRGHDVGFRNYESKWPDAPALDAQFDTLAERYQVDASAYR